MSSIKRLIYRVKMKIKAWRVNGNSTLKRYDVFNEVLKNSTGIVNLPVELIIIEISEKELK